MAAPTGFDTETHLIQHGRQAPRVVCAQYGSLADPHITRDKSDVRSLLEGRIVAHNAAYDMACVAATWPDLLPLIVDAYERDRIVCTRLRERLLLIADGTRDRRSSLEDCLRRRKIPSPFVEGDKGGAGWRLRYGTLDAVPLEEWPVDALRYALADCVVYELWEAQERIAGDALADQYRRARADFVLTLARCWGLRVDPDHLAELERTLLEERRGLREILVREGLVREDGTRNQKAARERCVRAFGGRPPETDKGAPSLSAETCEASGDPILEAYGRLGSMVGVLGRVARLKKIGSLPVQARFDVLKDTGRTGSSAGEYGDQIQNLDRRPGPRECYVPRPGNLFLSVDYSSAEMHTLAQNLVHLFGRSRMADLLNQGVDLHTWFGCRLHSIPYDPSIKHVRQEAKPCNFGFPGGLGAEKFVGFARGYGVDLTVERAKGLKAEWLNAFPEMRRYFAFVDANKDRLVHYKSRRIRGKAPFCAACNSLFQGLAADMGLDAGWRIMRECYLPGGVLFGARIVNFIHDEWMLEVPEDRAHECALRVVELMEAAGREWCPDVPPKAEPALMRRWRKGADPVYVDGRLIAWEDRPNAPTAKTIQESWKMGVECTI